MAQAHSYRSLAATSPRRFVQFQDRQSSPYGRSRGGHDDDGAYLSSSAVGMYGSPRDRGAESPYRQSSMSAQSRGAASYSSRPPADATRRWDVPPPVGAGSSHLLVMQENNALHAQQAALVDRCNELEHRLQVQHQDIVLDLMEGAAEVPLPNQTNRNPLARSEFYPGPFVDSRYRQAASLPHQSRSPPEDDHYSPPHHQQPYQPQPQPQVQQPQLTAAALLHAEDRVELAERDAAIARREALLLKHDNIALAAKVEELEAILLKERSLRQEVLQRSRWGATASPASSEVASSAPASPAAHTTTVYYPGMPGAAPSSDSGSAAPPPPPRRSAAPDTLPLSDAPALRDEREERPASPRPEVAVEATTTTPPRSAVASAHPATATTSRPKLAVGLKAPLTAPTGSSKAAVLPAGPPGQGGASGTAAAPAAQGQAPPRLPLVSPSAPTIVREDFNGSAAPPIVPLPSKASPTTPAASRSLPLAAGPTGASPRSLPLPGSAVGPAPNGSAPSSKTSSGPLPPNPGLAKLPSPPLLMKSVVGPKPTATTTIRADVQHEAVYDPNLESAPSSAPRNNSVDGGALGAQPRGGDTTGPALLGSTVDTEWTFAPPAGPSPPPFSPPSGAAARALPTLPTPPPLPLPPRRVWFPRIVRLILVCLALWCVAQLATPFRDAIQDKAGSWAHDAIVRMATESFVNSATAAAESVAARVVPTTPTAEPAEPRSHGGGAEASPSCPLWWSALPQFAKAYVKAPDGCTSPS